VRSATSGRSASSSRASSAPVSTDTGVA
jgi:hypothetical protein